MVTKESKSSRKTDLNQRLVVVQLCDNNLRKNFAVFKSSDTSLMLKYRVAQNKRPITIESITALVIDIFA